MTKQTLTINERDLVEVIIACCNGQMGREAACEVLAELDAYGFEVTRKPLEKTSAADNE